MTTRLPPSSPSWWVGSLVVALATAGAVAACSTTPAKPDSALVVATAGGLTVALVVDRPSAGVRDAEVVLTDGAGTPVTDAEITAAATMTQMGHAGEVTVGTPAGAGRYRLNGDLFPMPGTWSMQLQVRRAGVTSAVSVPIAVS
jgi:YtkA-like